MKHIGKIIFEKRNLQGLTQQELAEKSQVNLRTIQRIENNESTPRGKTLKLIAEVLDIKAEELLQPSKVNNQKRIGERVIDGFFLIILNILLMSIIGYLTLDSEANLNSRIGAILLSFFIPFFIVSNTKTMSGLERLIKFGLGFIFYIVLIISLHGLQIGFSTGLFPCLLIAVSILYFGNNLKLLLYGTVPQGNSSQITRDIEKA